MCGFCLVSYMKNIAAICSYTLTYRNIIIAHMQSPRTTEVKSLLTGTIGLCDLLRGAVGRSSCPVESKLGGGNYGPPNVVRLRPSAGLVSVA